MPKIYFKNQDKWVEVEEGISILDAAMRHGIPLYHTCGGNASCSTCRIAVLKGGEHLSAMEEIETQVLDSFDLKPPCRLGCQAQILEGDVQVEIPDRDKKPRDNKTPKIPE